MDAKIAITTFVGRDCSQVYKCEVDFFFYKVCKHLFANKLSKKVNFFFRAVVVISCTEREKKVD